MKYFMVIVYIIGSCSFFCCSFIKPVAQGPKFEVIKKTPENKATVYCFNDFTAMSKNIFLWYGTNISPDSALNINKGTLLIYPLSVSVNESDHRTDYLDAARYYCIGFEEWDGISKIDVGKESGTFLFGRGNQYSSLEYSINLAKKHNDQINIMRVMLAHKPLLAKGYFTIELNPDKYFFWITTENLIQGYMRPYCYPNPKKIVRIDLKRGEEYFIKLKNFIEIELLSETEAKKKKASILNCNHIEKKVHEMNDANIMYNYN